MKITINKEKTRELIFFFVLGISICLFPYIYNTLYKTLVIAVSGFMLLFSLSKTQKNTKLSLFIICWVLFVFWSYLSSLWSEYDINVNRVAVMMFVGIEVFAFGLYLDTVMKAVFFMKGIIFGALALAMELISFYGIDKIASSRISNEILNSNQAGCIFSIAGLMCFFLAIVEKKKLYFVFFMVLTVMITLTGSRTAILTLMGATTVFIIIKKSTSMSGIIKGIFIGIFLLLGILILVTQVPALYNIIGSRLIETFEIILGKATIKSGYNSNYFRSQQYLLGFRLIREHPVLGVGLDNFRHYNPYDYYAHTNYLEVWADLGLIGFLLFYMPFIRMCFRVKEKRKNKNWEALILSYIAFFLIVNLSSVIYYQIFDITIMAFFYYLINNEKLDTGEDITL